jgi:hypothetical protein
MRGIYHARARIIEIGTIVLSANTDITAVFALLLSRIATGDAGSVEIGFKSSAVTIKDKAGGIGGIGGNGRAVKDFKGTLPCPGIERPVANIEVIALRDTTLLIEYLAGGDIRAGLKDELGGTFALRVLQINVSGVIDLQEAGAIEVQRVARPDAAGADD